MKKNKKNFQILVIFLLLLPYQIFSEENIEPKGEEQNRKRLHIYSTPYTLNRYKYSSFRKRTEDFDLNVLLGITNKFFVGFTYNIGEKSDSNYSFAHKSYIDYRQIGEFSNSRYGEYFMFRTQYFFYDNFYGSLNAGVEKGFTKEEKYFIYIGRNIEYQPFSKITTFSNRFFGTMGIGYRKEFFENFIMGIEFEYGIINSGKIKDHYTFDPVYFNGFPLKYIQDLYFGNQYKMGNSEFSVISFYAGIAL
ncbi:hypothetical protein [Leptospira levettii]|uniref:hypothetical protein n=1 Tax=Leptospira levettii TaxID=2023178 RepID=UPI000C2A8CCD|nr:hypothetical protein [Leptospira levettii]PJZ86932.1 hypothetical protein CH368_19465 [Leptospira levettii]